MRKYAARRLVLGLFTLLLMSLIIFGALRILPGDVAQFVLGGTGGGDSAGRTMTQIGVDVIRKELGLDRPLHIQYLNWIWDIVRGDLGKSLFTQQPVMEALLYRLPLTAQLALMSVVLGLLIGIPMGIFSALKHNSWLDHTLRFWSVFFLAAPTFWLGLMFLMGTIRFFEWGPPMGYNFIWSNPKDNLLQLGWPALIIASHFMAIVSRMTRSTMLEVLREDYIRTARSKGLSETVVIIRHALKNTLIPVLTITGNSLGGLLGGTVIMEQVFNVPGVGTYFLQALNLRDYTVIQGVVIMIATFFILINLTVDLIYGWLDPRISYS
ncbi:MAG: ABC transporter permease [Dehalococcoidia bacterium]|nr:ABC transporter permease [Dehalococcoidia bacterium]